MKAPEQMGQHHPPVLLVRLWGQVAEASRARKTGDSRTVFGVQRACLKELLIPQSQS